MHSHPHAPPVMRDLMHSCSHAHHPHAPPVMCDLMHSCSHAHRPHAPPVTRNLMHSCSRARSYRRSVSPDVPNAIPGDLPFDSNVPAPGALKEIGIEIYALTQPTLQSGPGSDSAVIQTIPLIHFLCAAVLYEIKCLFGCIRK